MLVLSCFFGGAGSFGQARWQKIPAISATPNIGMTRLNTINPAHNGRSPARRSACPSGHSESRQKA
ncbi:MAG: hypothetical protein WDO70_08105 [Alphaproteobacteria bacterium]